MSNEFLTHKQNRVTTGEKSKLEKVVADRENLNRKNGERHFTASEVKQLLKKAPPLKAIIWLKINCGYGNTDCSSLPRSVLEDSIDSGWLNFPRPKGIERRCYFQKRPLKGLAEHVKRVEVPSGGGTMMAMMMDDAAGMLSLIQFDVVEMHTWCARMDQLDRPDRIVFDLNPDERVP